MTDALRVQMEFISKRFQDCVKEFDDNKIVSQKLLDDHKALNQRLDVESKDVDYLTDRISEMMNSMTLSKKDLSDQINLISNSVTEISKDIPLIKTKLQVSGELFEHCTQKMNKILAQINELDSTEKADVKQIYIEIDTLKNDSDSFKLAIRHAIMDQSDNLGNFKSHINDILIKINNLKDAIYINSQNIVVLNDIIQRKDADYKNDLNLLSQKIFAYVDDKFSSIPIPVIPSLEDAKKAMANVLEPVSLDAKNANLRSVNNETKVMILEKRLEQIQLVINSMKL